MGVVDIVAMSGHVYAKPCIVTRGHVMFLLMFRGCAVLCNDGVGLCAASVFCIKGGASPLLSSLFVKRLVP